MITLKITNIRREVDRVYVFIERSDDGGSESYVFMPDASEDDIRSKVAARAGELNAVQTQVDALSASLVGQVFPQ